MEKDSGAAGTLCCSSNVAGALLWWSTCHSDSCGRISWNNLNSKPAPLCCPWGWFPKSNWASAKFSPFCEKGLRHPCSTYRLSWPARNAAVTPEHYYCCRLLLSMYTRHGAFPFWSWVRWVCQRTSFRRQQLWLQTPKPLDEPQDLKRRGPPCRGMISTHPTGPDSKTTTLPETSKSHLKLGHPERKRSYSDHILLMEEILHHLGSTKPRTVYE